MSPKRFACSSFARSLSVISFAAIASTGCDLTDTAGTDDTIDLGVLHENAKEDFGGMSLPVDLEPGEATKLAILSDDDFNVRVEQPNQSNRPDVRLRVSRGTTTIGTTTGTEPEVFVNHFGSSQKKYFIRLYNPSNFREFDGVLHLEPEGSGCTDCADEGDLRLWNGDILQIHHNDEWRGVCDDSFGIREAQVACRQLGGELDDFRTSRTGQSGLHWLDDVDCHGTESKLAFCDHSGYGVENCSVNEHIALDCRF